MKRFTTVALATVLLAGCTTYQHNEKKVEGYNISATRMAVRWVPGDMSTVRITKISQGGIPVNDKEKQETFTKVHKMWELLPGGVEKYLLPALKGAGVTVVGKDDTQPVDAMLTIVPTGGVGDCRPFWGCMGAADVRVAFEDGVTKKTVWSSQFKVGPATYFGDPDDSTVENFYSALLSKLKSEQLVGSR